MNRKWVVFISVFCFIFVGWVLNISGAIFKKDFFWLDPIKGVDLYNLDPLFYYISDDGATCGGYYVYKESVYLAALYTGNNLVKLQSLGGLESCIFGGSDNNVFIGWALDQDGSSYPVSWDISGKINKLINYEGKALGISYNGQYIVGWYDDELGNFTPFIYDYKINNFQKLSNLYVGNYKEAYINSVNDSKNMCGRIKSVDDESSVPFLYLDGKTFIPAGISEGAFYQISNNNKVVGYIVNKTNEESESYNAVVFENNQVKKIFDDNRFSIAYSISKDGKVVAGYFQDPTDNNYVKPFIYYNNKVINLEEKLKTYLSDGSFLEKVVRVSSNGNWVIGVGYNNAIYQPFAADISNLIK